MERSGLLRVSTFFAAMSMLTGCGSATSSGGTGGTTGNGGSTSSGGTTGNGGSGNSTGGTPGATGGTGGKGTGGTTGGGGSVATGGTTGQGGSTGAGGSSSTGGTPGTGGSSSSTGGTPGTGGSTGTGGTTPTTDPGGVPLAKLSSGCLSGDPPTGPTPPSSPYYFNLGDIRLVNNRWGSDVLNCSGTQQSVCINSDGTIGWNFNRPTCGGSHGDPDFPEVEFGVAPFGNQSSLLTTPTYSSTSLLPIQISNLQSATLGLSGYTTNITSTLSSSYWDGNFEFWISREDPTANANAGVYAEIIMFMNYEPNRNNGNAGGWNCDHSGTVTSGSYTFTLCHESDTWSNNQWRFFNFMLSGATSNATNTPPNGTADIKAILDWVMSNYGSSSAPSGTGGAGSFSNSMYLTRVEVGTEVDDNTAGSVKISNISFSINGTTKGLTFGK